MDFQMLGPANVKGGPCLLHAQVIHYSRKLLFVFQTSCLLDFQVLGPEDRVKGGPHLIHAYIVGCFLFSYNEGMVSYTFEDAKVSC